LKSEKKRFDLSLDRYEQPNIAREKLYRVATLFHSALIGVHAQVRDQGPSRDLAPGGGNVAGDL